MAASKSARVAARLLPFIFLCSCATSGPAIPSGTVFVTSAEMQQLRTAVSELRTLQQQNRILLKRIGALEARVGLRPFEPRALKGVDGMLLQPRSGTFVTTPDARAQKKSFKKHLASYDGYVLAFWATWCKPCTSPEELARLQDLQTRLKRSNVELVSVLIDDLGKARSDRRAASWLYPFWFQEDAHLDMLPKAFIQRVGLNLPLFLVVSRTGELRYFYNAALTEEVLREIVTATARICRS